MKVDNYEIEAYVMKALQNKLLILIVSSTLIPALVVMVIVFSNYGRIVDNDSGQIMQLMCSEKRQAISVLIFAQLFPLSRLFQKPYSPKILPQINSAGSFSLLPLPKPTALTKSPFSVILSARTKSSPKYSFHKPCSHSAA